MSSVDICIPTYNSGKTLKTTLKSLLAQTHQNITIHVVDNQSTDRTLEIAQSFEDSRVMVHENCIHIPYAEGNWNRCFSYMNGDFAAIFHADDIYLPNMIETQVKALEKNIGVCAVFTGAYYINGQGGLQSELELPEEYRGKKVVGKDVVVSTLRHGCKLICSSPLFRTHIFRSLSPFRYDQFGYSSDLDFWIRAAEYSKIMVLDESLMAYRVSDGQASTSIHHLRTSEAGIFRLMDHYVSKYPNLPQDALDMYEMRRFEDKLVCIRNLVKKLGPRFPHYAWWGFSEKFLGGQNE